MEIAEAAAGALPVVLGGVGIEDVVAPVIEQRSVPLIGAGLDGGIDVTAAGTPVLGVVGIHHHFEFLDGFDVGSDVPGAVVGGDGRAVEEELVGASAAAVHGVAGVDVPTASAGEAGVAECSLGEHDAGGEGHEHVGLAAVERILGDFEGIEDKAAGGVGGLDEFLVSGDRDGFSEGANDHGEGELEFVGNAELDVVAALGGEAIGGDGERIGPRFEEGNGIKAFRVRRGLHGRVGAFLDEADGSAWNRRFGRIGDLSENGRAEVLRHENGREHGPRAKSDCSLHDRNPLTKS